MLRSETIHRDCRVAVLIAAHDASATIGAAVKSALSQPETAEVVVVDDASTDDTADRAHLAAQGDPRLRVLTSERNIGPGAARNIGISASSAPVIALLDADDIFLPGRLRHLTEHSGWDFIADNIVFVPEGAPTPVPGGHGGSDAGLSALDLAAFARGNLARGGRSRGELGFLKPLMRRAFLDRHRLRYDPALRLGEDYDLYVRALMAGARFLVSHNPGYMAHIRAGSLSGRHRTDDLLRLHRATRRHLDAVSPAHGAYPALRRVSMQVQARYLLRACLDRKAEGGVRAAMSLALSPPSNAWPIARGVLRDKARRLRSGKTDTPVVPRYLLPMMSSESDAASAAAASRR